MTDNAEGGGAAHGAAAGISEDDVNLIGEINYEFQNSFDKSKSPLLSDEYVIC